MNKIKLVLTYIFINLFSLFVYSQAPCSFPEPITTVDLDEDENDCGITGTMPELNSLADIPDVNGPQLFFDNGDGQGIPSEEIIEDYSQETEVPATTTDANGNIVPVLDANGNPVYLQGPSTEQILGLTSLVDQQVDISALMECSQICIDNYISNIDIDLSNLGTLIGNMTPAEIAEFNANIDAYPNGNSMDYGADYFQYLSPSEIADLENTINDAIPTIDWNADVQNYFGGISILCNSGLNQNTNLESNAGPDLDLFSANISSLAHIGGNDMLPSPSAMQMINQVQTGVDLYNGLPSVGTSLYTLQSNDLSVPVSVSYNGGGVNIDAYGTELGTNWSLNAGGQISRIVNGLPDEFNALTIGSGIGPVSKLKPCIDISGAGLTLFVPHKRVIWNPLSPTQIKLYISFPSVPIPTPIPFLIIPTFINIELTISLNTRYKPDHIIYEEEGLGYLSLNDASKMDNFNNLSSLDLGTFNNLSGDDKADYLESMLGVRGLEDTKFISPAVQRVLDFWSGAQNIFQDEVKEVKKLDTEPDEFYFNFGGYSGKFIFDQSGNIYTIPHTELLIEEDYDSGGNIISFIVTTPEGMTYTFGGLASNGVKAVDFSEQTNYTLPNQFAYPVNSGNSNETYFDKAGIDETSLPYRSSFLCLPRVLEYGSTYENNYTVMRSPAYSSTWHLTEIKSLLTNEIINLDYTRTQVEYVAQKSISHDYPNFEKGAEDDKLETTTNGDVSIRYYEQPTEYQGGKASLVYSISETKLHKVRLTQISGQRGEVLKFEYNKSRPDIVGDVLLTDIDLYINDVLYKGWFFDYEEITSTSQVDCSSEFTTEPVYSVSTEFEIDLGGLIEKKYKRTVLSKNAFHEVGGFGHSGSLHKSIFVEFNIVRKELPHHQKMTEFGSFIQIKAYEAFFEPNTSLDVDIDNEIDKFDAESGRAFLSSIKEKDRNTVLHDFVDFDYFGNLSALPKRFSFKQDLWGYYTELNNDSYSLLPKMTYTSVSGVDNEMQGSSDDLTNHFSFNNPLAGQGMFSGQAEGGDLESCKIGAVKNVNLFTGGVRTFEYELNTWPTQSGQTIEGAGLRVSKLIEDPQTSPTKETKYYYKLPSVVNYPIKLSSHGLNLTSYGIEKMVRSSSSPYNRWMKNKNHFVGYGKVIEDIITGGSIEHFFITPESSRKPPEQQGIGLVDQTISGLFFNPDAISVNNYSQSGEPFPMILSYDWRYGLEEETHYLKENGDPVKKIETTYEFTTPKGISDNLPFLGGIKAQLFQQNYPGHWLSNFLIGEFLHYLPEATSNETMGHIVSAIQLATSFQHPFRRIHKYYLNSLYHYEIEQVRLLESTETTYFDDQSTVSVTTTNDYKEYPLTGTSKIYRLTSTSTAFSNGQAAVSTYEYADVSILANVYKMNIQEHANAPQAYTALHSMGLAGYGIPLKTVVVENGANKGGINAMTIEGGRIVPFANWKILNNNFYLTGKVTSWDTSSGLPTVYELAKFPLGSSFSSINDYDFFAYSIDFVWDNNLLLDSKTRNNFSETYTYTNFKELETHTGINGILSNYTYNNRGWLKTSTALNARQITEYSYSFQPNFVNASTTFNDGTPSQGQTDAFNGFAMPTKTTRHDGATLSSNIYDQTFKVVATADLTRGVSTHIYEASPISRLLNSMDEEGNEFTFSYSGNIIMPPAPLIAVAPPFVTTFTTDPNGYTSEKADDAFSRTAKTESAEGSITLYAYNGRGQISAVQNPIDELYSFDYNDMEALMSKTVPGAAASQVWYDEQYRIAATQDGNGNQMVYQYDDYGLVLASYIYDGGASNLNATGIVSSADMEQSNFNSSNLARRNTYAPNKTWVKDYTEIIFKGDNTTDFNTTTNSLSDIGEVVNSYQMFPEGFSVQSVYTYNSALLLQNATEIVQGGQDMVTANVATTFDGVLRPERTEIAVNSGTPILVSKLKYNGKDLVKTNFLGKSSTDEFLQKVDYSYDATGRIILINSPVEMECYSDEDFCTLQLSVSIHNSSNPCTLLSVIILDGQAFNVTPFVDLNAYSAANELESAISQALGDYGLWGDVTVEQQSDNTGQFLLITVENTNVETLTLQFDDCTQKFNFDNLSCCDNESTSYPTDPDGTINYSPNDDLFFEKITYDGLDIKEITIGSDCTVGFMRNKYSYDGNHRLIGQFNTFYVPEPKADRYSTNYTYDLAGNLTTLKRNGLIDDVSQPNVYGAIDDLKYTYSNQHLELVEDLLTDPLAQAQGFKQSELTYGYDGAGNITSGTNNGTNVLSAIYNPLNLPQVLTGDAGSSLIDYTLSSQKIRKEDASTGETKHYFAGFEFKDGIAETYYHANGRVDLTGDDPLYQYTIGDHLGNTMVLFADKNDDGLLTTELDSNNPVLQEILKRDFYYPFGLSMDGKWKDLVPVPKMDYLYNGKELDEGTGWYDYGARMYDPSIGRWNAVDPLADSYTPYSPYNYTFNNPLSYTDPDGKNPIRLAKMFIKIGWKTYKTLKKAGKFNRKNFTKAIKDAGLDEVVDLIGDLYTIVAPESNFLDRTKAAFDIITGFETNNKGNKAVKETFDKMSSKKTNRAARRESMRDEGIPTSQQPKSQSRNESGREYQYEVPKGGGGTQTKSSQQQTMDRSHKGQPHWETGPVKTDRGTTQYNQYGRPKLQNDKSKVNYNKPKA